MSAAKPQNLGGPIRGVILDMDGVLVDSEPVYRRAAQASLAAQGLELTDEQYGRVIGLPHQAVHDAFVGMYGDDLDLARYRHGFFDIWRDIMKSGEVRQKTGADELLAALTDAGIPFGLATSTHRDNAETTLDACGLGDAVRVRTTGDEVVYGKPNPEIMLRAAAKIGVPAVQCVVLEDSPAGIAAALHAKCQAIMVPDLAPPRAALRKLGICIADDLHAAAELLLAAAK